MNKKYLFVISGPSSVGKKTIKNKVIERLRNCKCTDIKYIPTYTTRPPGRFDVNQDEYQYVSDNIYNKLYESNLLIGSFEKNGFKYGLRKADIQLAFLNDNSAIIIVDPSVLNQIKERYEKIFSIYLFPENINELKNRLKENEDIYGEDLSAIESGNRWCQNIISESKGYDLVETNADADLVSSNIVYSILETQY